MNILRWEPFREMTSLRDAMAPSVAYCLSRLRSRQSKSLRVKKQKPKAKMPITELHSPIAKLQEAAEQSAL